MSILDRLTREAKTIYRIIDDGMIYAKGGDQLIELRRLLDEAKDHISKLEDINLKLAVKLEGTRIKKPQVEPVSEERLVSVIMEASAMKRTRAQAIAWAINAELVRT